MTMRDNYYREQARRLLDSPFDLATILGEHPGEQGEEQYQLLAAMQQVAESRGVNLNTPMTPGREIIQERGEAYDSLGTRLTPLTKLQVAIIVGEIKSCREKSEWGSAPPDIAREINHFLELDLAIANGDKTGWENHQLLGRSLYESGVRFYSFTPGLIRASYAIYNSKTLASYIQYPDRVDSRMCKPV